MIWNQLRKAAPAVVCVLTWLLLAAAAPLAFGSESHELNSANSSIEDGDQSIRGVRLSEEPVGSANGRGFLPSGNVAVALRAVQVNCELYAEHEDCRGTDTDSDSDSGAAPTAVPTPTPTATPDPRILEAQALAQAQEQAIEWIEGFKPAIKIWPEYSVQIVTLESYLYVTDRGWETRDFTKSSGNVWVTVRATPTDSIWQFTERTTNAVFTEICTGRGEEFQRGDLDTDCGRTFEHSSSVTGTVDLATRIGFELTAESSLASHQSAIVDGAVIAGPLPSDEWTQELEVLEVLTYGIHADASVTRPESRSPHESGPEEVDCNWLVRGLLSIVGVSCEAAHEAYNLLKTGVTACAGGLVSSVRDSLNALKDVVTDPIGTIRDGISGITELIDIAKNEPGALAQVVAEGYFGISLDEWNALSGSEQTEFAVGFICGKALEYITGRGIQGLLVLARRGPGGNGSGGNGSGNDGSGNDGSGDNGDNSDGDNDNDNNDRPGCPTSSFATGTPVLMADGSHLAINQIRPGDWVMSHNFDTSVWEPRRVLNQWSHVDRGPPATLTITDGSQAVATADHLFWVETTQAWTELQAVSIGHDFLTPLGTVELADLALGEAGPWLVWELTVEHNHNFAISTGSQDILVHNCGLSDADAADSLNGMRNDGGHASRHLIEEGLIANSGSLASKVAKFRELVTPILTNPTKTFDWRLGATPTKAFASVVNGQNVVVFVAQSGQYAGKVVSAVVADAAQIIEWGL